jgi:hypothetical protein
VFAEHAIPVCTDHADDHSSARDRRI